MKEEAARWFSKAEEDLADSCPTLDAARAAPSAFFAQQAAEKALKAILVAKDGRFPKVHDLAVLARMAGVPAKLAEKCRLLSPAYVAYRYPDVEQAASVEDARELIGIAEEVDAAASLMRDLDGFRGRLRQELGRVDHVVLFGSHATGTAHRWSDVDLVVVSPAFEGLTYIRRAERVHRVWDLPYPVDILCYTPEEFDRLRDQVSIVRVALDEGTEVGVA